MPMDLTAPVTITAPAASDGRGGTAVLNSPTSDTNFVGYVYDASGFDGPAVRTSMDDVVEGPGAVFGSFQHGVRSFTLEIALARGSTPALSFANRDKLYRAVNAMAADGTFLYTETGGSARVINFRREQPPRGPDKDGHVLVSLIASDPRIYANATTTLATGTITVGGNVGTPPLFVLTSPTNTITLTRSSPSPSQTLTLTGLSGAGTVTVDFLNKTVTATSGAADRYAAVSFPSSTWWELIPGSNTVSVSGATVSGSSTYRNAWL